ncbi:alpha/beta fold hydrolase [Halomonas sp. LR5S13]|uniref:alpha/beta fold hydrolase n=1 Tax=Halomonas rhizosphaerae TaxID=3043296 RepID=UPI0024A92BD0|nr:alpha/beta fold hydrolase [Halomonas rhizosphaerae]MDI5921058.1 alpha/beta fold hydrolase [Halomonas rhizosphaerae]
MESVTLDTPAGGLHAARWRPETTDPTRSPIVLLHDSLGCVALWREFPARLAAASGREVIAYDRLGYGKSAPHPGPQPASFIADEAEAFRALREHFRLARFVALGHSVGGGMAAEIAGQHVEGCEALITVAAQAFNEPRTLAGIREAEQAFQHPAAMARLARYHGDKADWVLRSWTDTWHSEAFAEWTLDPALHRVSCPTLTLHGEHDEYGSLAQPRRIARLTPGPVEPLILACGHVPHRECPARLIAALLPFLADPTAA